MKCLIATVGKGVRVGGEEDIAKLLAFTIKNQNPDCVTFVCTEESRNVISLLEREFKLPPYDIILVEDLLDHEESFSKIRGEIKRRSERGFEVVVDFTSGTKPMSAGALLAAADRLVPVSYVKAKRSEGKPEGPMQLEVREFPCDVRSRLERLVQHLFDAHQFKACIDLINTWAERFPKLSSWSNLIEGYYLWDTFHYQEAKELLEREKGVPAENKEFLGKLVKEGGEYSLVDLYANSQRRGEEGKFDDATARLYSLVERIAHWRIREGYGIDPSDVPEEEVPEVLKERLRKDEKGKIRIEGLWNSLLFLKEKSNPLGSYADDQELKDLLSKRNFSPLAHGDRPVGREIYEKFSKKVKRMLEEAVPQLEEMLRKCSFPKAEKLFES